MGDRMRASGPPCASSSFIARLKSIAGQHSARADLPATLRVGYRL